MSFWMEAAERSWLPEGLERFGIRRLLRQRLAALRAGGCEAERRRSEEHLASMNRAPVALATREANEQHYEIPPQFFRLVLGRNLKYSSCLWAPGVEGLDEAEEAMLELTCRRAALEDGMKVLDLGCGWGSLSLWIAERFPRCRVVSVSNSAQQRLLIERRRDELGLESPRVVTADMNEFDPGEAFDRVISIEMFEHMRNWRLLLRRIRGWLEPRGKLFFHVFCHRAVPYFFTTEGAGNWMGRYFFTGGMMPSDPLPLYLQQDLVLEAHWRVSGDHYARTARAWGENLSRRRGAVMGVLEETYGAREARRWFGRWRLFFLACEELFAYSGGDEWFVAHYLAGPKGLRG